MPTREPSSEPHPAGASRPLAVWLAGTIGWDDYAAMAERLAGEVAAPDGRLPTLVVCELAPCITIGRLGSRADVRWSDDDLKARQLTVRFTGRGGGAVLHGQGQVVVALFAALADLGLGPHDVGGFLARLQTAVERGIATLRCGTHVEPDRPGVFGRSGLLAALGVAVRRGVVSHGAFVNVCPALDVAHRITTVRPLPGAAGGEPPAGHMGSVEADVQRKVRLQDARTALVQAIGDAFAFPRSHINAGFPFAVRPAADHTPEMVSRVG